MRTRYEEIGGEYSPGLFDGAFKNVSGGVDEDVEAAYLSVQVCDGRAEFLKIVGDVEICCDGAVALQVF